MADGLFHSFKSEIPNGRILIFSCIGENIYMRGILFLKANICVVYKGAKNYSLWWKKLIQSRPGGGGASLSAECPESVNDENKDSDNDDVESVIHVRGLSLASRMTKKYVNADTMVSFAKSLLKGEKKAVVAPQFQLITINQKRQIQTRIYHKKFGCPDSSKRAILLGTELELLQSMPFGYSEELLISMKHKYNK